MKVIIGGTFDLLHAGHKALLRKAFELGEVKIGLVSDEMSAKYRVRQVENFLARKKELEDFIKKELKKDAVIFELSDKFGPAAEEDFDYIVTSPETYAGGLAINEARQKAGKKPIEIVKIDFVMAADGKPISSSRIAAGEIDRWGELLK